MRTLARTAAFGIVVLALLTGCVPTISMHKYRDVAVTITDSGEPVAHEPFRVVYTFNTAENPLALHVELRTPEMVSAATDEDGKAIVELADYEWNIYLVLNKYGDPDYALFVLPEEVIRDGGTRHANGNSSLQVELNPVGKAHLRKQENVASR